MTYDHIKRHMKERISKLGLCEPVLYPSSPRLAMNCSKKV